MTVQKWSGKTHETNFCLSKVVMEKLGNLLFVFNISFRDRAVIMDSAWMKCG